MKITFLGSGSAFVLGEENYHSNLMITSGGKNLLFDAGSTIAEALNSKGLTPGDVHSVFISHLHDDHAGGIEYLAFKTYFSKFPFGSCKPHLLSHNRLLIDGWDTCWRGGLQSLQGESATLETYFHTHYLPDNDWFVNGDVKCSPIQTIHVVDDRRIVPSFGMMLKDFRGGKSVFISGDSQFAPNQMLTFFEKSDTIFHDCEFAKYPNSVHAQFHELCNLPEGIKAKMWLYHYSLNGKTFDELNKMVVEHGFAGLVKRGEEFEF